MMRKNILAMLTKMFRYVGVYILLFTGKCVNTLLRYFYILFVRKRSQKKYLTF